jgi:hypothetical protein
MRGTRTPTNYRNQQCPYCRLYFHGQGLHGHIMFAHKQRFPQAPKSQLEGNKELVRKIQQAKLVEEAIKSVEIHGDITDDIIKKAFKLFMTDYIFNRGIFSKDKQ